MKRSIEIDAARGFMLAWMTLTHLPTVLTPYVNQPFGYVGSSEGFIFLSALFTGRIYLRLLDRSGPGAMTRKLLGRTSKLYAYHIALLLGAFMFAGYYAVGGRIQSFHNLLDFYFAAGPGRAIRDALLLGYRPPLLDIIPLYILFLLFSPLLILLSLRIGWKPILAGSFALWLAAQFGLRQVIYSFMVAHLGLRIPLNEMGAFNLWAWQLVWVSGIWIGARWARETLPAKAWARRMWIPAAIVAVAILARRYAEMGGLPLRHYQFLFDKWNLGVVRLVDLVALGTVLIRFQSAMTPFAIRPIVEMGQSSLRVFCAHFACCFVGIGMMGSATRLYGWRQIPLVVGTFLVLWSIAKLSARKELAIQEDRAATEPAAQVSITQVARSWSVRTNAKHRTGGPLYQWRREELPAVQWNHPSLFRKEPPRPIGARSQEGI